MTRAYVTVASLAQVILAFALSAQDTIPPRAAHVEGTVVVDGVPRTVQLISVPRPARLAASMSVRYRVSPTGAAPLLGARDGMIDGVNGHALLTVAIPAAARAGRVAVAVVHFAGSDRDTADVPVDVLVRMQRRIVITPMSTLLSIPMGGHTTLRVQVENQGNAVDSMQLHMLMPPRWRVRTLDGDQLVLAPGEAAIRTLDVRAPGNSGTGVVPIAIIARGRTGESDNGRAERSRLESMLEVTPTSRGGITGGGPQIALSASTVAGPAAQTTTSIGAQVRGPISQSIQAEGRWMQQPMNGAPGLARVGAFGTQPFLSLSAPTWRVDLGNAGVELSEISGVNTQGRGVSAHARGNKWELSLIEARPQLAVGTTMRAGAVFGAKGSREIDGTAWSATMSHLRDGRDRGGALDAMSVGADRHLVNGLDVRAEVASRRFDGGHGFGALAELAHHDANGEWRVRAVRAPGGADAFALARTDITGTVSERIGALRFGALSWYADDAGQQGRTQSVRGVSIMPQWRVGERGTLGGELRASDALGGDKVSRYSSATRAASAFGSGQLGRVSLSTSATTTLTRRAASVLDSGSFADPYRFNETQLQWMAQMVVPTRVAVFDIFSALQKAFGASVFFSGQHELQLRVDNVLIPRLGDRLRAGAALGHIVALDGSSRYVTERVSITALLPFDAVVRMDAERNPLFNLGSYGSSGSSAGARPRNSAWMTVLRIERSFGTPGILAGLRSGGVVFEDADGDGRRDAGERGIAGVVVRAGGEVAITDRGGVYRFARRQSSEVQVDERSLPFGLMLAPRQDAPMFVADGRTSRDIAVEPVGTVEVQLKVVDEPYAAGAPPALASVAVLAIDAEGRRFLARGESGDRAIFDALPPGEYRVQVDGSGATEPLTVRSDLPSFTVGSLKAPLRFTVLLGPRRLRLFRGQPSSGSANSPRDAAPPSNRESA